MKVVEQGKNIILQDISCFQIEQILECGQCFRYEKLDQNKYTVVSRGKFLYLVQDENEVTFYNTSLDEYNNVWRDYFDTENDYNKIIEEILRRDDTMKEAIEANTGIRIVKQEPWETLISFIISQNKQIPHIKKIVETLSSKYGDYICNYNGKEIFAFPTVDQLSKVSEEELRECKVGFRAPYIMDACNKVKDGTIDFNKLRYLPTKEASEVLMKIKGVGEKVADCVLLFSLGKIDVFPTDVWIKRVVESKYFNGKERSKKEILEFANKKFGDVAGYAQQYLFYYGRGKKVGKNIK